MSMSTQPNALPPTVVVMVGVWHVMDVVPPLSTTMLHATPNNKYYQEQVRPSETK